ncbi:MAG: hypothetical protein PHS25_06380 [Proteiniphilum sp.]|jgi:hypothetical protein|nr:hypothetical protein [Proteiniphilum sp.]MDD2937901.1 hypothetical protein [Proteiniphilum sp.]MDD3077050.1 hypothetical protein [Proteiniphilum sp.]MDD3780349.1 hypothetical protein [Proteiniphilum sp.]MDD3956737.1 hypothetical protein [Proteiniphilum sp.]
MKRSLFFAVALVMTLLTACTNQQESKDSMQTASFIPDLSVNEVIAQLKDSVGEDHTFRIERGVRQVADLWQEQDGTVDDFAQFCTTSFVADKEGLASLFATLERNFEVISGYYHKMDVELKIPLQLVGPDITPVDMQFGSYNASAHLTDDLYDNKIAFLTALNFPFYSLEEKTELGEQWSREEWAYARMGDRFISRVPAAIQQDISRTVTEADAYISDYNIFMGKLRNEQGEQLFPDGMKLISHWGLRDELKSNYADPERGLEKQRMIYKVMQRIVDQSIPLQVINNDSPTWIPETNELTENGQTITATPEDIRRYEVFLKNFQAMRKLDAYSPHYPTQLVRAFDGTMEVPQKDVEELFKGLLSSPQVKEVASFIASRLGRELEPFDIWYNGFRAGGGIPEEDLTAITSKKYPDTQALERDLPNILVKLGWNPEKAKEITALITVDNSRGAGHAWGAEMRNDVARLRTRIGEDGMDYKGYNIAVHEFGHNVEQTITMNDVDYYMLNGVPNTAFTEAVAFLFQKRDLELLGLKNPNPEDAYYLALDNFWSSYEIMGVSLVDIQVWEWLYAHPDATPAQLKEAVIRIAKEVWNSYYADVLGGEDEMLLGIYSHMIDYPLYLPNYPMGHLIAFQIEQQVRGKNMAMEIDRMFTQGRIIPQRWMKKGVGSPISIDPLLNATREALQALDK